MSQKYLLHKISVQFLAQTERSDISRNISESTLENM